MRLARGVNLCGRYHLSFMESRGMPLAVKRLHGVT